MLRPSTNKATAALLTHMSVLATQTSVLTQYKPQLCTFPMHTCTRHSTDNKGWTDSMQQQPTILFICTKTINSTWDCKNEQPATKSWQITVQVYRLQILWTQTNPRGPQTKSWENQGHSWHKTTAVYSITSELQWYDKLFKKIEPSLNWTFRTIEKTIKMRYSLGMGIWATNRLWKDQDYTDYTFSLDIFWQRQGSHHTDWHIKDWTQCSLITRRSTHSLCIQSIDRHRVQVLYHRESYLV